MVLINRLEKKFGKYAINNLIYYVLAAYIIGYVFSVMSPNIYDAFLMKPELVCKGQVWRMFTWIFTIPQELDVFVVFMILFYLWIGNTLEKYWGAFKYNLYMISGWFFMTVGTMLIYIVSLLATGDGISLSVSTNYINLTSFLACATVLPDVQVLLLFVIPLKMKWLAIVDLVILGYEFVNNLLLIIRYTDLEIIFYTGGEYTKEKCIAVCASIVISLLNFILFYFNSRYGKRYTPKEIVRKKTYKRKVKVNKGDAKHKCAICGRTENDDVGLVFRFCSRCEGNYEYCQDHLFTHEHVKE